MWETVLTVLEKAPSEKISRGVRLVQSGYDLIRSSSKGKRTGRAGQAGPAARNEPKKGAIAGLIGGIVASMVMKAFQRTWDMAVAAPGPLSHGHEPEAEKIAAAVSQRIFKHTMTPTQKKVAVPAVHYAFGATAGAAYGAAVEYYPELATERGLPFGAGMMALNDEIILPRLGLTDPPTRQPLGKHLFYLASHLVYGVTCEFVRKRARHWLDKHTV